MFRASSVYCDGSLLPLLRKQVTNYTESASAACRPNHMYQQNTPTIYTNETDNLISLSSFYNITARGCGVQNCVT